MKNWDKIVRWFNSVKDGNDGTMPLAMRNYIIMLFGVAVIIIGFLLMSGGTKATPEQFSYDIFSFRRITLAPIVVIIGFGIEIYAIMKRFK